MFCSWVLVGFLIKLIIVITFWEVFRKLFRFFRKERKK